MWACISSAVVVRMHVVARPVVDGPTAAPAAHASLIVTVRIALPFVPAQRFYRRRFRLRRSLPNTLPPLHLKPLGFASQSLLLALLRRRRLTHHPLPLLPPLRCSTRGFLCLALSLRGLHAPCFGAALARVVRSRPLSLEPRPRFSPAELHVIENPRLSRTATLRRESDPQGQLAVIRHRARRLPRLLIAEETPNESTNAEAAVWRQGHSLDRRWEDTLLLLLLCRREDRRVVARIGRTLPRRLES
mmetsp:Transcript_28117/g.84144  ORF Transcript_28117/g.84144 Transcript_28117/m.84144 type:complete len:246 (-) Transcript_28117:713-1450(-)